jgi:hypothetical protein
MHCRRIAVLRRCAGVVVCLSMPAMHAAVCLLYVSAVRRRVAVLHVRPLRHSLDVYYWCVVVVVVVVVVAVFVFVCQALVLTCMVSLSCCCDLRERHSVTGLCLG